MKTLLSLIMVLFLLSASPVFATWTDFDGVDDIFTVTQFAGINIDSFTAMCHVDRDTAGENSFGRIFDKAGTGVADGWVFSTDSTGGLVFFSRNAGTDGEWSVGPITSPSHVAVAYDGSSAANDPSIYVNGVLQTETEDLTPETAMVTGTRDLIIGNRAGADRTWDGRLGDCAIFTGLLDANAILSAMHYGPQWVGGNICYWPMGTFSGRSYGGTGGSSCNATAGGSPATAEDGPKRSSPQGGFIWLRQ